MAETIDGGIAVEFPASCFATEAVKRAAYTLMARLDVGIEATPDGVRCILHPAKPGTDMAIAERDFRREVLDQDLRISIERQTATYRDAILGLAFSKTGLQDG